MALFLAAAAVSGGSMHVSMHVSSGRSAENRHGQSEAITAPSADKRTVWECKPYTPPC